MKGKTTSALLALFLGCFGIHRFYLGQGGQGFLYLLFCWTGIPSFIAFIDGIGFLIMDRRRFDQKYNYRMMGQAQVNVYNHAPPQESLASQSLPRVVNRGHSATPQLTKAQHAKQEKYAELKQLHDMKEQGILNEDEYDLRKAQILARMEES